MHRLLRLVHLFALATCLPLLIPAVTDAVPIAYQLTLTVSNIESPEPLEPPGYFNPLPVPGDAFFGHFVVDSALLEHDGTNLLGVLSAFRLEVGGILFDASAPTSRAKSRAGPEELA